MFCRQCGANNLDEAQTCASCGAQMPQPTAPPTPDMGTPAPQTSGMAIASLVLGIFGFCTCITAIPGLILGLVSMRKCNERPQEVSGKGLAIAGIVTSCVSIAVMMLFMLPAILFPVFARAREAARKATCMNNMKQMAQALKMYSDDYDGTLPSSVLNKTTGDFVGYGTKLCVNGQWPPRGGKDTWPQILYDNMRNKDIMWCPSDKTDHDPASNPEVSYWYKYALDRAWRDLDKRKIADLGYESDQLVFFEHKGWHFGDETGLKQGLTINASYADTHVETITLPSQAPPESSPIVSGADSTQPYEPFYFNVITDQAGNPTDAPSGPLDPDATGKWYDPSVCYDRF